ncbi:MAG: acyltransferase [Melioribacteraceae bacterium]|nr:acyltransferase [Melioribacteraceae bacterium]
MLNIQPTYLSYFVRTLPNFLWPLKWYIIKKSLCKVGSNFKFGYNSEFFDHRLIEIGDNVFMGLNTVINTNVKVNIGNNVMFGRSVTIMGGDHNISEVGIQMRFVKSGGKNIPITIEDDVWIGSNVTILKGVKLGEGCVVGAGSVIAKSLPPYSICVGNPCKPIKLRFNHESLKLHINAVKSKYTFEEIISIQNKWAR